MKKHYLIFFLALFIQCESILGQDQTYLQPENITGEWLRVMEVPSDVAGLYRKDTAVYQIGLDKLTDYIKFVDKNIYKPLTFKVLYPHGGLKYGYLHEPDEDYDWDREESTLNYNLELGMPENTTRYQASFSVPKGFPLDTLRVTIDSETFGLKKRKGL